MALVGFVLKPTAAEARDLCGDLAGWLVACGHAPVLLAEDGLDLPGATVVPEDALPSVDLVCALGGDGTMLRASRVVGDAGTPILGVNLGQLGFLAGFLPAEARVALTAALAGELRVEERSRLAVTAHLGGESVTRTALNDAVLHQGAMARIVDCDAWIDDAFVASYRADGLIVSTPTGSTAYNMAAGGPIMIPGAAGMTLTPICAHSLTNRPLVVPARSVIRLELTAQAKDVVLTVDGQWAHPVVPGDRVEVTCAARPLRLLAGPQSYFDVMRDKLHWGLRGAR
ncbi:MAG: NAD(+)/NADH kinase [Kofleriaceae bacterium]|nr:NAD(+)/NADH kinase [Kofleriaceae bacterium]MBP9172230.1 NAD(+)/NADH kinase [Kofleriaceae bacterium]MBP9861061.1 NAD(+)/NADH kinase [Kofleriaceae bacterium]